MKLSYEEIKERVNLPDEDVIRILHSITCGKYRVLAKEPNNKTINKTDNFSFNAAFTDRMRRIKVGSSCFASLPLFSSKLCSFPDELLAHKQAWVWWVRFVVGTTLHRWW